jgi:hypothetical protein
VRLLLDVRAPDHPVRGMSVPDSVVLMSRMNLSVNTDMRHAGSHTVEVKSIVDDMDGVAEPITPLGRQHDAWVCQRGLPYGLEHHGHA